jgi:hypothetical protein
MPIYVIIEQYSRAFPKSDCIARHSCRVFQNLRYNLDFHFPHPVRPSGGLLGGNETAAPAEDGSSIYLMDADGSMQTRLANMHGKILWSSAWSPDGKRILFSASGHSTDQWWLTQPLGISSVLLQSLILIGFVLLRPAERRSRFYLFAFTVPVIAYSFYFATVAITQGIGWTIHLWAGTVVLAGVASLLLAILLAQGLWAVENGRIMNPAQS